jgi:hypothetical protein
MHADMKPIASRIEAMMFELEHNSKPMRLVELSFEIRRLAERLEYEAIALGTAHGQTSWSAIGAQYGLTKQGMRKRFERMALDIPGPVGLPRGATVRSAEPSGEAPGPDAIAAESKDSEILPGSADTP